jgi:hypothetical protein
MERVAPEYADGERITITVDFSCLDKKQQPDMATLRQWQEDGLVEIRKAEEIENEFRQANPHVREKLKEQYFNIDPLRLEDPAIFGMARFDRATFDGEGTLRDGKRIDYYFKQFKDVMFPRFDRLSEENKKRAFSDVMYVSTHYILERDIFLTRNIKHFAPKELRGKFPDLSILTPIECINCLKKYFPVRKGVWP